MVVVRGSWWADGSQERGLITQKFFEKIKTIAGGCCCPEEFI